MKKHLLLQFVILLGIAVVLSSCSETLSEEQLVQTASRIAIDLQMSYPTEAEIVPVNLQNFEFLDPRYYEQATQAMKELGWVWLGDLEMKNISRKNVTLRTCIRVFGSPEGTSTAAVWQLHRSRLNPKAVHAMEFETEFSPGSWLVTNNLRPHGMGYDKTVFYPEWKDTDSVKELWELHQERLRQFQSKHADAQPLILRTQEDVIQSQKRQARLQAIYRRQIKGITEEELLALGLKANSKDRKRLLEKIQTYFMAMP